jgi:N-acetylglucosaminyldiphosphoundecaprenol N-acetyl-beta-D-mannosaminyltransferase
MAERTEQRIEILGCPFDAVDMAAALATVEGYIASDDGVLRNSVGVNLDQLLKMKREPDFAHIVAGSDLITADGTPVVWWSRVVRQRLPERVPSIDLMYELLRRSTEVGHKIFLLGAKRASVEAAAERFRRDYPGVHIVGLRDGYFSVEDEPDVVREINASGAQVLFIAITSPKKEEFIGRNRDALDIRFALGVGGAFDIAAGLTSRAPVWMRRVGLEWAWRMSLEPKRMAPRVLDDLNIVRYLPGDYLAHRRRRKAARR